MRNYLAEAFGAFVLALAVGLSLATPGFPVATPIIAGVTLAIMVYTIGPISGAHINPAVTIGLWSIKRISASEATNYVIAQSVGGILAYFVSRVLTAGPATLVVADTVPVGIAELLGAALLVFAVTAVVFGEVPRDTSGAVIGAALLIGITIATHASNGILNPAVALGIGSFSLMYIVGPILGGFVGAHLYRFIHSGKW